MSINLNDNIQVNSGKPLDSRYLNGLSAYTSVAAVNAAIPISTRYLGLTVLIATVEYWYQSVITDVGLIIKSGGSAGTSQPIIRCVYLVADAADATSMGGTAKNTYTTFQTAYDAANALQASLGSNSIVTIMVGNTLTTSASGNNYQTTVGNLTLAANYNSRVRIHGINSNISILGGITASNVVATGFSVGASLGASYLVMTNIRMIADIVTSATGTTGNSGTVSIRMLNSFINNIFTNTTNAANTTGAGGTVTIIGGSSAAIQLGSGVSNILGITTNSMTTTTAAGIITITVNNLSVGSITTALNNLGGSTTITGTSISNFTCNTLSNTISSFDTCSIYGTVSITGNASLSINNCNFTSTNFTNTTSSATDSIITNSVLNSFAHNSSTTSRVIISNSTITTLSSNIVSSISSIKPYICLYDCRISTITVPSTIVGVSNLTNITNSTSTGFRSISIDNITNTLINNITYTEATTLATNNLLKVNQYYTITDRGDRGIRLMAASANTFSIDGERYMLCPTPDYTISFSGFNGWFNQTPSVTTGLSGTKMVWGGKVWLNITGNAGIPVNDFTLSADWTLVNKSTFTQGEYVQKTFKIKYDFLKDEIYEQSDELGNTVGGYVGITAELGYNPCDVTDWLCFYSTFDPALSAATTGTLYNYYKCVNNTVQQGIFNNYLNGDSFGSLSYLSINDNIKCKKIANNVFTFQTFIENNINCTIYKNNDIDRICNNIGCDLLNNKQPSINTLQIVDCSYYIISNNTSNNGLPMIFNNLTSSYSAGNPYGGQSAITLNTNVNNVNNCINVTINNCANYGIISNCNNITLSSITSTGITINNVINLNLLNIIFSTDLPLKNITISNNTIRIFVEYLAISPGKKYMSCIPFDNCRLKSAVISGVGLNTGNYTFGVETDNETYMPATTGTTLNSTPQLINTISGILTKGKRLVINQSTVTVGTKLDAWVELFYY